MKKINPVYYWPTWFIDSFNQSDREKIQKITLNKLAKGQIYLWNALNIYDDILDNSSGAENLPLANKYFRQFLEIYYRLALPGSFYELFNSLLDNLENANQKEAKQKKLEIKDGIIHLPLKTSRSDRLVNLSKKSLALSSGPLAIIYLINNKKSITKIPKLISFFKYCLAAKQLADDAKDWFDDLKNGALTYPNKLILIRARKRHIKLDLKRNPELIYLLFTEIAPKISKNIKYLCQRARREGKKINISTNNQLIVNIIKPLERAVLRADKFRKLLKTPQ